MNGTSTLCYMYSHSGIQLILVAIKVSCHCYTVITFNVKNVTLKSTYDSIFSFLHIFDLAPIAFQTIYEIVTLTSVISNCIAGFVVIQVFNFP